MKERTLMSENGPALQWLGTSGFRIEHAGGVTLVDPFLARNRRATPVQVLKPADMADADHVFVSHGHHDHLFDVPLIVEASHALVYCSRVSARTLARRGVPRSRIVELAGGENLGLDDFGVEVTACRHSTVDLKLMLRAAPGLLGVLPRLLVEEVTMPAGPMLAFRFLIGGVSILHLGSMCGTSEAQALGAAAGTDIFLAPLRGRSDICELAADVAEAIRPAMVVPQHHDDFMPPLSPPVDPEPFRRLVEKRLPDCVYYEPEMNLKFNALELLGGSTSGGKK